MDAPKALPWSPQHPEIETLTHAIQVGVTPEAIVNALGTDATHDRVFGNRSTTRINALIDDRTARNALLDQIEHLATCLGHDGTAKRAAADRKLTDLQLERMIRDSRAYAREHGIDTRTEAQKNPAPRPASPRQVDYILDLLSRRTRSGEEGGFYSGPTDRAGIQSLTTDEASAYIDSLKGTY